jgi:SAM-dependent methyltransferase
MAALDPPGTPEQTRAVLDQLAEIQAHREWVIDGLREHVANLEAELRRARERIAGLEEHAHNLELESEGTREHAANLEKLLAEQRARLADVEAHAANLERRAGRRGARLAERSMFPEVPYPRLNALLRLGERIWSERADLRERFPLDRAADYWYWLLWHGVASRPEWAGQLYPLPDPHLIHRVVGEETSAAEYLRGGLVDGWRIDGGLREAGFDPVRGGSLLDFGVGCGRILQYFALYAKSCRLVGADVDETAVDWCAKHLDFAAFRTLPRHPPSPFADGEFDAVYAFSVFSHLPEALHLAWLAELARITRPGAALVVTVHGRHVIDEISSGRRAHERPNARQLARALPELEERGFAFFPYRKLRFRERENERFFASWDLEEYGDTFILERYVREHWTQWFEVVALHEAPDDWQDQVVLRRRAS